jgi:hypothetical protein
VFDTGGVGVVQLVRTSVQRRARRIFFIKIVRNTSEII